MARKKNEKVIKQAYADERKSQRFAATSSTSNSSAISKASFRKNRQNPNDADNYFDKNDKHFVNFNNQLTCMGLMIRNINGDGNCLFRALNDQLEGHSRNHMQYRQEIVRYMMENRKDFEPFVEDDVPFEKYMGNLCKDGTFGGQDVLVAFARMRKVNIVIHQLNSPLWHINGGSENSVEVHLSYHNGEHYSSIRKLEDTNETAANIKLNIQKPKNHFITTSNKSNSYNDYEGDMYLDNEDFDLQRIMTVSGCSDLVLARQTLIDCNYDVDDATDCLTSLMLVSCHEESCDETATSSLANVGATSFLDNSSTQLDSVITPTAEIQPCSVSVAIQPQSGAKPKKPVQHPKKHLSNKERKDQRRKERVEKQKTKLTTNETEPVSDEIVVTNLGSLNL